MSLPDALENASDLSRIGAARPGGEVFLRSQSRNLFRQRHVNELIESYPFGFGEFACFVEQGRLQPHCKVNSSHDISSSALSLTFLQVPASEEAVRGA